MEFTASMFPKGVEEVKQKESETAYVKNDQEALETLLKSYLFGR